MLSTIRDFKLIRHREVNNNQSINKILSKILFTKQRCINATYLPANIVSACAAISSISGTMAAKINGTIYSFSYGSQESQYLH